MRIGPNRIKPVELIRIRSVHTLVTESEFNHKLCKIYLQIYYLGSDNAAELQYSLFISISIVYVIQ